jgi:hypothetical protein
LFAELSGSSRKLQRENNLRHKLFFSVSPAALDNAASGAGAGKGRHESLPAQYMANCPKKGVDIRQDAARW